MLHLYRCGNILLDQVESGIRTERLDVASLSCEEVVEAKYLASLLKESGYEMRTDKARSSSYKYRLYQGSPFGVNEAWERERMMLSLPWCFS